MARESTQTKLSRVRPPRVQISYEVQVGDAIELKEIPFVLGVLGDFSGNPAEELPKLKDRKFVEVTPDNFDDVLASMKPRLAYSVANKLADDPDAPSGLFTHWLVWNIPPQTSSIAEGSAPKGVHGANDFGKSGYGSPCPPSGTHRYSFKIFALDSALELRSGAKRSQVDAAMKGHVIAQGELVGRYARKK